MKSLFLVLTAILLGTNSIAQFQIGLPTYKQGRYENDTIYEEYRTLTPTGNASIGIDPQLSGNFITGIEFKMVVDTISLGGAASVNVGDTLLIPVSFQLFTGSIGFHIIIEGTPEIAGESYLCDLALNFTTGMDWGLVITPLSNDSCFVESIQGIEKVYDPKTIHIFPNPTHTSITINVSEQTVGSDFVLIDKWGRQVLCGKLLCESTVLDISHLEPGVYFLSTGKQGNKVITVIKK